MAFGRLSGGIIAVIVILVVLLLVAIALAIYFGVRNTNYTNNSNITNNTGQVGPTGPTGPTGQTGPAGNGFTSSAGTPFYQTFAYSTFPVATALPLSVTFTINSPIISTPSSYFVSLWTNTTSGGTIIIPPSSPGSTKVPVRYDTYIIGNLLYVNFYSIDTTMIPSNAIYRVQIVGFTGGS